MYRLPLIAIFIMGYFVSLAQSPHGEQLKMNCAACHSTDGWDISADHWNFEEEQQKKYSTTTGVENTSVDSSFNHYNTAFPLLGTHATVDCRACHETLVFDQASTSCVDCHLDVHSMTVGNDCIRCHNNDNWLVDDIPEIHEENGFPLTGSHSSLSCVDCHISETNLRFDRIGNECISCHQMDFDNTTNPNHHDAGFSTNCLECHRPDADSWDTDVVNHDFFPLILGHDIADCKACHLTDNFSDASPECISCHQADFDNTTSPDHQISNFSNDCASCHTTNPGWMPAEFTSHDVDHFPIYSGEHEGEWSDCLDCHSNPNNYQEFTCIGCHINPETDNEHDGVTGYIYEDNACLACHPTGDADMAFDHDATNFPLTGAHIGVECLDCHSNGFEGTSTACVDCHTMDFEASLNPNHTELNIPTDCASCHTTDLDWMPATFDIHDDYYPLEGAHALIANDCVSCHNGDYNNTPNTCVGCHSEDYNATTDPNHAAVNFSTDCTTCHTQDAWEPSTFDHDGDYFPIYSGEHEGEWSDCVDCHTDPTNFMVFTCIGCHINPETDNEHDGVTGYIYEDNACLACHPTGDGDMAFDHDATNFPLTGAHIGVECLDCHSNGFEGTSTACVDCHTMDFEASLNPNHTELNIPTDCASCHTTDLDWMPATFDIHDDYYPLEGAHAMIANNCASCHNGDYNNTPNTCVGCHLEDYNATTDPNHAAVNFSTDCTTCHTQDAWEPSTFDHDGDHFPIYTGEHDGEWSDCIDCHTDPTNFMVFTCIGCHINPETDEEHIGVSGYIYEDNACLACHPTGDADMAFDHDATNFPLTGAHIGVECLDCHGNGFEGTSTACVDCHTMDFEGSLNPNHTELNIPTDCASCHTTDLYWMPATFDIHDDYYPLEGAHAMIANDCASCHNGDYTNTPNTCVGCHLEDYNATTNPDHAAVNFSTDCTTCHTQDAWEPSTFDHDSDHFPIYTGEHDGEWSECIDCHTDPTNFMIFTCIGCHINPETDEEHISVSGYVYEDNACLACHPTGDADMAFDHGTTNFPLTGAHIGVECLDCHSNGFEGTSTACVDCHTMDFEGSLNPNHTELNIPTDCASCHTTDLDWMPATFDIHDDYYTLEGAHAMIANDCASCHNGDYTNTPNTCVGCHLEDYNGTTDPDHEVANFSTDCTTCHTQDAWEPSSFDHGSIYALNGAHAAIADDCLQCHADGYENTPNTCIGCHQTDYDNTTDPNHTAAGFPTDCTDCHTESAWLPATFDHDGQYFPIYSGEHEGEWSECVDCHTDPNNYMVFTCIGCHINPETDDDHNGIGGYIYEDNACLACHPMGEADEGINHDNTNFPLTGAHVTADCLDCHANGFVGTSTVCVDCHQIEFNGSSNPNHISLGLSTDCVSCHTTDPGWSPATFEVHDNYYELTGAHAAIATDCATCHNGDYTNTPNTCVGCHQVDYDGSTNPNHQNLNIPTDCASCHTTDPDWNPATFDIHDNYYTLNGAHAAIANDCASCHNGDYNNTPNTCIGCHQADYDGTTNPDHQDAMLSSQCLDCHTENAWTPSTFDHGSFYPLNGAHAAIANNCLECHANGYTNTPNTCIGCHQTDYDNTNNPDHAAAGFPTDCLDCHSETAWTPATFDHDGQYFPIYSGKHEGEWNECVDCHINSNDYSIFSCIDCHEHDNQNEVDNDHDQVNGYSYNSTACYSCHPTGED